jgi:hypothetical protein
MVRGKLSPHAAGSRREDIAVNALKGVGEVMIRRR